MGTSKSSPGPGKNSPLVPPWADDQPQKPIPSPQPRRFKSFRQSLGSFIKNNDSQKLRSALGHYARKASGGGISATRRMGSATKAGASLYHALTSGGNFGKPGETAISLNDLAGQPCDIAIGTIIRALSSDSGDIDKIRTAMNNALVESLDGIEIFDPNCITDEIIVDTMINYLAESIFLQIVIDGGKAWNKAETPIQAIARENDLRELINVIVDKHMAPKLVGNVKSFSHHTIIQIEREVIIEVWNEWEEYH